jgi:hypothetical protein
MLVSLLRVGVFQRNVQKQAALFVCDLHDCSQRVSDQIKCVVCDVIHQKHAK